MGWWIALLLILMFGFAIRMAGLLAVRHNYDHSFPIAQAVLLLDRWEWPLEGQRTTVGLPASPLTSWALAPAVGLFRHPWAIHGVAAMLDVLALALLARLLRARFEGTIVTSVVLLAAASPWRLYFARGTWLPAWFPVVVTGWLALLWPCLTNGRRLSDRRALIGWALAAISVQIHPVGGLLLIPWALTLWLCGCSRRAWGFGLLSFVLWLLPTLPGLWGQRGGILSLRGPEGLWPDTPVAFAHALRMISGRHFAEVWAAPVPEFLVFGANAGATALELLIALGAFRALAAAIVWRRPERLLPLLWWGVPALGFSLRWPYPIHVHYLVPALPSGSLLLAEGLQQWIRWTRWRGAPVALGVGIAWLWAALVVQADRHALQRPWTGNIEELPMRDSVRLAQELWGWLAQDPNAQVILPAGCAETIPLWLVGLAGRALSIRCGFHAERLAFAHHRHAVVHVLAGPAGTPPLLAPLGYPPSWSLQLTDGSWLALYVVRPGEARPSVALDLPTDVGWRLLGYTLQEREEALEVITLWSVERLPWDPMQWSWHMQPFHHLLNQQGHQLENPSGFGVPGFLWREGDIYVDRTSVRLPPLEGLRLEIGLFDPNRGVRAHFLRPEGQADTLTVWRQGENHPVRGRR